MLNVYEGNGINDIYPTMVDDILENGVPVMQRGLRTLELTPVVFQLEDPRQRLVTTSGRVMNVAFALAEVLWILAGRQDVAMLAGYNSRIEEYSDDGVIFNAAYGHRLRHAHGFDQLEDCITTLQKDEGSRQAVLVIWLPQQDKGWANPLKGEFVMRDGHTEQGPIPRVTKDRACNLVSHMLVRDGQLHWTQFMRSNDALWGLPYNLVQWTHIQEYVATRLGVEMGTYTHLSDSLHIYDPALDGAPLPHMVQFDLYEQTGYRHQPMITMEASEIAVAQDIEEMLRGGGSLAFLPGREPSFWHSMFDLFEAHNAYRFGRDEEAYFILRHCADPVYGTTQIRFYMHQRWGRNPDSPVHKFVREDFSGEVRDWLYGVS